LQAREEEILEWGERVIFLEVLIWSNPFLCMQAVLEGEGSAHEEQVSEVVLHGKNLVQHVNDQDELVVVMTVEMYFQRFGQMTSPILAGQVMVNDGASWPNWDR